MKTLVDCFFCGKCDNASCICEVCSKLRTFVLTRNTRHAMIISRKKVGKN